MYIAALDTERHNQIFSRISKNTGHKAQIMELTKQKSPYTSNLFLHVNQCVYQGTLAEISFQQQSFSFMVFQQHLTFAAIYQAGYKHSIIFTQYSIYRNICKDRQKPSNQNMQIFIVHIAMP